MRLIGLAPAALAAALIGGIPAASSAADTGSIEVAGEQQWFADIDPSIDALIQAWMRPPDPEGFPLAATPLTEAIAQAGYEPRVVAAFLPDFARSREGYKPATIGGFAANAMDAGFPGLQKLVIEPVIGIEMAKTGLREKLDLPAEKAGSSAYVAQKKAEALAASDPKAYLRDALEAGDIQAALRLLRTLPNGCVRRPYTIVGQDTAQTECDRFEARIELMHFIASSTAAMLDRVEATIFGGLFPARPNCSHDTEYARGAELYELIAAHYSVSWRDEVELLLVSERAKADLLTGIARTQARNGDFEGASGTVFGHRGYKSDSVELVGDFLELAKAVLRSRHYGGMASDAADEAFAIVKHRVDECRSCKLQLSGNGSPTQFRLRLEKTLAHIATAQVTEFNDPDDAEAVMKYAIGLFGDGNGFDETRGEIALFHARQGRPYKAVAATEAIASEQTRLDYEARVRAVFADG